MPESAAHTFAGVCRDRWNEIMRRNRRVPVVVIDGMWYVPLNWIESRRTEGGRRGMLYKLRMGLVRAHPDDVPLRARLERAFT